jgi:hypothetical protein
VGLEPIFEADLPPESTPTALSETPVVAIM